MIELTLFWVFVVLVLLLRRLYFIHESLLIIQEDTKTIRNRLVTTQIAVDVQSISTDKGINLPFE